MPISEPPQSVAFWDARYTVYASQEEANGDTATVAHVGEVRFRSVGGPDMQNALSELEKIVIIAEADRIRSDRFADVRINALVEARGPNGPSVFQAVRQITGAFDQAELTFSGHEKDGIDALKAMAGKAPERHTVSTDVDIDTIFGQSALADYLTTLSFPHQEARHER